MKYVYFISILILSLSLFLSCEDLEDESCSGVICDAPMFTIGLEYLDAETGENLLFGEAPPYSVDDLSAESIETGMEYFVTADSTLTDKYVVIIYGTGSDIIQLTLGDLSPDTLYVNTLLRDVGCCGDLMITDLSINEKIVCTDCDVNTVVEILK